MTDRLQSPVFFIGMPRSGTTVVFESFARHPMLGWPSNYTQSYPSWPSLNAIRRMLDNRFVQFFGRKNQYGPRKSWRNYLPQPNEAYRFWDRLAGSSFSRSSLAGQTVTPEQRQAMHAGVSRLLAWQGRPRFAAKLTGPPRLEFLSSAFEDPYFIHVIRDGRAVVDSLLRVGFWSALDGHKRPFWSELLTDAQADELRSREHTPGELAALQWRRVIELARKEAAVLEPYRYLEVRYENFVADPEGALKEIFSFCHLPPADSPFEELRAGPTLRNMNSKYVEHLSSGEIGRIEARLQPLLGELGYL